VSALDAAPSPATTTKNNTSIDSALEAHHNHWMG
jgi:hypothetical protein